LFRVRPLEESRAFPEIGLYLPEPEMTDSGQDAGLLRQIASFTGGLFEPQAREVFDPGGRSLPSKLRLWPGLLAVALVLNFVELLLRRLRRGMPAAPALAQAA
jgi:hypothetical protein